ncbi:MAG: ferrochelatase [Aquificaceae bacterium]|nr:ferrochelatase [Aquificaceae bacterium]
MIGVVLLNMGGPDSLNAIQPFLYNLFSDRDIIPLPSAIRLPLAFVISHLRARKTVNYYRLMGGCSPQKEQTLAQAKALQDALGDGYRVVVALRYWHPMTEEAIKSLPLEKLKALIALPLYPQYSKVTTGSSFKALVKALRGFKNGIYFNQFKNGYFLSNKFPIRFINCYFDYPKYIQAMSQLIIEELKDPSGYFFIFSAHSLPKGIVEKGDPYIFQIEQTVKLIMQNFSNPYALSYQSKVGPNGWVGPFTEDVLKQAIQKGYQNIAMIPVSFTCEHSETLYEMDYVYGNIAKSLGANFVRIKTLQTHPLYIEALKELVVSASQDLRR